MIRIQLLLCLVYLTVHSVTGMISWNNHDPTTMTGDLDRAQFCENETVGSHIYTLNATGASNIKYKSTTTTFNEYVSIDEDSGTINLTKQFDRELFSTLQVLVEASDGTDNDIRTSTISFLDANDNEPVFSLATYVATVYEDPWTTDILAKVSAEDSDNAYAQAILFSMNDSYMTVNANDGSITLKDGMKLNYENQPVLQGIVNARDRGNEDVGCGEPISLSSNASVIINVADGPDSAPFFIGTPYYVELNEMEPKGTSVFNVTASDADYGLGWDVVYSLLPSGELNSLVEINDISGEITLVNSMKRGVYTLNIQAEEVVPSGANETFPGVSAMQTSATLTITINDINDNKPTFYKLLDLTNTSNKVQQNIFNASLEEGTSNFIAIPNLYIYVEDIDVNSNAVFSLQITQGVEEFTVSPEIVNGEALVTLRVRDSTLLDYEKQKFIDVKIEAKELGTAENYSSVADVLVNLTNINDASPEFETTVLKANVSENAKNGSFVILVKATDTDDGLFGQINYTISANGVFEIVDPTVGEVTVSNSESLDRETRDVYYVTITATDGGNRFSTATLEIQVLDVNDMDPIFQRSLYYATLQENSTAFSSDVLVYASDDDEPNTPNSEIVYSIIDGDVLGNFNITDATGGQQGGQIIVDKPVDLETLTDDCSEGVGTITLTVMASDQGIPQRHANTTVIISVEDVNDKAPTFDSPEYNATVEEKSKYGVTVTTVNATDGDSCSPNNLLDYQIGNGGSSSSSNMFLIETANNIGILKVKDINLDLDLMPQYDVEILAIDRGITRMTGSTTVVVTLIDVNDKFPVFNATSLDTLTLREDTPTGEVVRIVTATDTDKDSNLMYNITGETCRFSGSLVTTMCSDRFRMDTNSTTQDGALVVIQPLDREHIDSMELDLVVEDLNAFGDKPQRTTGKLSIILEDVNDNKPVFVPNTGLSVNEQADGAYVGEVVATDEDIGINAEIEYSVGVDSQGYIEIDKTSGQINTISGMIDREEIFNDTGANVLNVTLVATDMGEENRLNTSAVFSILILDINDHDPQFAADVPNANLFVKENEPFGTFVFDVNATDNDMDENAALVYSLPVGDPEFKIDRESGIITTGMVFDREKTTSYQITVQVRDDPATSQRSAEVTLTVEIGDVDDNEPTFDTEDKEITADVAEGLEVNSLVAVVPEAHDPDSSSTDNYYFLVGGSGVNNFAVNQTTRVITTDTVLDRETIADYDLVVWVTNNASAELPSDVSWNDDGSSNESMMHVIIIVTDVNDNRPIFTSREYETDIPFDTQPDPDATVYTVSSTDQDTAEHTLPVYSVTGCTWVLGADATPYEGTFGIQPSRNGLDGDIYLVQVLPVDDEAGFYRVTVQVTEENTDHLDEAVVIIGIVKEDQTVILYSRYSPEEFVAMQDEFINDLESLLNVKIYVDKVIPHEPTSEQDQANSDIYIHAKELNSTQLIPATDLVSRMNVQVEFLNQYGVIGNGVSTPEETGTETDFLKAGLIIACAAIVLVILVFSVAIACIHSSYKRKMKVAKATENAAQDLMEMNLHKDNAAVPNTNPFANKENPLYDDIKDDKFAPWPTIHESNDDDDSIDDNAVDNQDSAIDSEDRGASVQDDFDDNLNEGAFEIEFNDEQDNERLAAALNARKGGKENLTFLFDDVADDNGATFM